MSRRPRHVVPVVRIGRVRHEGGSAEGYVEEPGKDINDIYELVERAHERRAEQARRRAATGRRARALKVGGAWCFAGHTLL